MNKKALAVVSAAAMLLAGCGAKDTQGQVAQYSGTAAYSGTNWTVETNSGEITVKFDGPFASGWQVDTLGKRAKISGHDDTSFSFDVTKSGDNQIILFDNINTDGCVNRQSLQINYTADSNKRLYDVVITPAVENVPTQVAEEDLKGLSEDEQNALYDKVSSENAACRAEFEKITSTGGTFSDGSNPGAQDTGAPQSSAQPTAGASDATEYPQR